MSFHRFKEWAFLGLLTAGLYILWDMKKSVENLNEKVATVIERSMWHEKIINRHEDQINALLKEK